jgi:hypothetical protein
LAATVLTATFRRHILGDGVRVQHIAHRDSGREFCDHCDSKIAVLDRFDWQTSASNPALRDEKKRKNEHKNPQPAHA